MLELTESEISFPKLSICVMTYNLENYISQTLDSILMQKVDFDYDIVIGDDASTDRTREILQQYASKYPHKIKLLLQPKNVGVLPNFVATLKLCKGKYIATLDGDDYWTDPLKLQKQVDFLESNKDYSMVFHNAEIHDETKNDIKIKPFNVNKESREYSYDEITRTWSVPTCSVVAINNKQYRYIEDNLSFPVQDLPFYLSCASNGKIYYISDTMGVYRRLQSCSMNTKEFKSIENMLSFVKYYKKLYENFCQILTKETIDRQCAIHYLKAANKSKNVSEENNYHKYLFLAMEKDSQVILERLIEPNNKELKSLNDKIKLQNKTIHNLQDGLKETKKDLNSLLSKINQLVTTSAKTKPIKKYKAYKSMLKFYYTIKKGK